MQTMLFSQIVRGKRHAVSFRERVRQAARLLRFTPVDQAAIAAAGFVVAYQALSELIRPRLVLGIDQGNLCIEAQGERRPASDTCMAPPLYRFVRPLPAPAELAAPDLAWIVAQVTTPRAADLFEEMHRQNQEMLALVHALQERERELERARNEQADPSAA
jgi:hypothetical protein